LPTLPVPETIQTEFGDVKIIRRPDGLEDWKASLFIRAMGKPTMTQASKNTKKAAVEYLTIFCPKILAGFNRAAKFVCCESIVITAYFETNNNNLLGLRYDGGKPDATNIQKGIEDALLIDDSRNDAACSRRWGSRDRIDIQLFGVRY